jgi:2-polyprenyl-3-methyl-5-hydroxy-6-metoxy-1,4-benzoquinol methylase
MPVRSLEVPDRAVFVADSGSFRDRDNRVYDDGNEIVRGISAEALENWKALDSKSFFRELLDEGKLVATQLLPEGTRAAMGADDWPGWLSHQRIPFVTYPYEWSFGMLKDAALLQLELVERAFLSGWTLKDATAYNIQWIGTRPVFIDIPSFTPYEPGEPWVGYRQFCMMFLYPLMLQAYRGIDFQPMLRADIEGIDPMVASRLLSGRTRLRSGVLSHVYLHAKMQSRYSHAELDEAKALTEESGGNVSERRKLRHSEAMVLGTIQGLRRIVGKLRPPQIRTTWGSYDSDHSYGDASFEIKKGFVDRVASSPPRRLVWDLGCNTGTFSEICANHSDYVLAVDGDPKAIERLYQSQKAQGGERICPLIMNLANISPGQGWRSEERKAFDSRTQPDLILCLALIHHIVISANIPLASFLGWLRTFDSEVVMELVTLEDDMSKLLLRNKENQYGELTEPGFEAEISSMFRVVSSEPLKGGHRKLYHLAPQ